jgi:putative transposase
MPRGHPARLEKFNYLGIHRYFLTFCTFGRRDVFTSDKPVHVTRTQILRAASQASMAILADCYMPDHLHLLVEGQADHSNCRQFISQAKQMSGYHYQRQCGHRLWQRYGYDRVLRTDEETLGVARYIFENPLRAGLVERVLDYPFLGSSLYTVEQILEAVQLQSWKRRQSG